MSLQEKILLRFNPIACIFLLAVIPIPPDEIIFQDFGFITLGLMVGGSFLKEYNVFKNS